MRIAQQPVDKQSRPAVSLCISNCGELVPQIKPKPTKTLKAIVLGNKPIWISIMEKIVKEVYYKFVVPEKI